jgi:limonene-1,2-epoxide hydrolase
MSEENMEIVRAAVDNFSHDKWDAAVVAFDPDVVWVETQGLGPDASSYTGIAQLRGAVERWVGMWQEYAFEVVRYEAVGDEVVLLARERGHGGLSGVSVRREVGGIYTMQHGRVVRVRWYGNWTEALEAAGLSE